MVWPNTKWDKFGFQIKFDLDGQGQSNPKTIRTLTKLICIFPNLVVLSNLSGVDKHQMVFVHLAYKLNLTLKVKVNPPPPTKNKNKQTIGVLTKLICIFCPNLVVLTWRRDELWRRQTWGWQTNIHSQTDAGIHNIRRPKLASGKNDVWCTDDIPLSSYAFCFFVV